jgi:hypothetical protein
MVGPIEADSIREGRDRDAWWRHQITMLQWLAVLIAILVAIWIFAVPETAKAAEVSTYIPGRYELADRIGVQTQTRPPPPPPLPPPPPAPQTWTPGNCDSVAAVFRTRGATDNEIFFFFGRGVINRETRCGLDTLNEATGDSGICQINPVHNRAGYFWGKSYGDGGWLRAEFGLQTRQFTSSPAWVNACLYLYRKEGGSPWNG